MSSPLSVATPKQTSGGQKPAEPKNPPSRIVRPLPQPKNRPVPQPQQPPGPPPGHRPSGHQEPPGPPDNEPSGSAPPTDSAVKSQGVPAAFNVGHQKQQNSWQPPQQQQQWQPSHHYDGYGGGGGQMAWQAQPGQYGQAQPAHYGQVQPAHYGQAQPAHYGDYGGNMAQQRVAAAGCQSAAQFVPPRPNVLAEPPQPPERPDGPNRPAGQSSGNRGHRHNSAQLRRELWFEHCTAQVQTEKLRTAEADLKCQQMSSRLEQQEQKLTEQNTKLSKIEETHKEELSQKQSLIDKKEAEKDALKVSIEKLRRAVNEKDDQLFKLHEEKLALISQAREKDSLAQSFKRQRDQTIKDWNCNLEEKRVEVHGLRKQLGNVNADLSTQKEQGQKLEKASFLLEKANSDLGKKNADLQKKVQEQLQRIVELEKELRRQKESADDLYKQLQQQQKSEDSVCFMCCSEFREQIFFIDYYCLRTEKGTKKKTKRERRRIEKRTKPSSRSLMRTRYLCYIPVSLNPCYIL